MCVLRKGEDQVKKLIMCQGLPGSGKTTWAKDTVRLANECDGLGLSLQGVHCRVNKDDIRRELELTGWQWSPENEKRVIAIRDERIQAAFMGGASVVISDDTNLGRKHRVRLEQLARECGATFEIRRFDVPVAECIRRDALREGKARVGEEVIRRMAAQYHIEEPEVGFVLKVQPDLTLPPAIVCDLDGTLSLAEGRSYYEATGCSEDKVNQPVLQCVQAMLEYGTEVLFLSGRFERYRLETVEFLSRYRLQHYPLYMRADGDTRKDYVIKGELFDKWVRGRYNVLFVLDDRQQVVDYWRRIGLTCFQVAPGNF